MSSTTRREGWQEGSSSSEGKDLVGRRGRGESLDGGLGLDLGLVCVGGGGLRRSEEEGGGFVER